MLKKIVSIVSVVALSVAFVGCDAGAVADKAKSGAAATPAASDAPNAGAATEPKAGEAAEPAADKPAE